MCTSFAQAKLKRRREAAGGHSTCTDATSKAKQHGSAPAEVHLDHLSRSDAVHHCLIQPPDVRQVRRRLTRHERRWRLAAAGQRGGPLRLAAARLLLKLSWVTLGGLRQAPAAATDATELKRAGATLQGASACTKPPRGRVRRRSALPVDLSSVPAQQMRSSGRVAAAAAMQVQLATPACGPQAAFSSTSSYMSQVHAVRKHKASLRATIARPPDALSLDASSTVQAGKVCSERIEGIEVVRQTQVLGARPRALYSERRAEVA